MNDLKKDIKELVTALESLLGDNSKSDAALELMTDMKDSITPVPERDTDAELKALDDKWRQKYRDAFFSGDKEDIPAPSPASAPKPDLDYSPTKPIDFSTLFN